MSADASLSLLPPQSPIPNSLVQALCDAAAQLGVACQARDILAHSGWGFAVTAAEEWCDPATLLYHPRMLTHVVEPLAHYVSHSLRQLSKLGLDCHDAWFAPHELESLHAYIQAALMRQQAVVLWGCHGPQYACIVSADSAGVYCIDAPTRLVTYAQLYARGGIHVIGVCVAPCQPGTWRDIVAPLALSLRVDFATPHHPLRDFQTWHIGVGAWDVLAMTATQAAPLALVATHVAQIVTEYAWRLRVMRDVVHTYVCHATDEPAQRALSNALDDCCFYIGILYKHYHSQHDARALTTADGELIATVCRDIAGTLRGVRQEVHWWAEQDSNL